MIIDAHAHALDEGFLDSLSRRPAFGLSVGRRPDGRFRVKRGGRPAHSLDENLTDVAKARGKPRATRRRPAARGHRRQGSSRGRAAAAGVDYARALNEHGARVVAKGQGRLKLE